MPQRSPANPYRGSDGRYYSPFGIAQSVWNIPFYLAGRTVAARLGSRIGGPDTIAKAAVALATVPAVALLGLACFTLLLELGAAPDRAAATIVLLVLATPLWPYSGFGFNQPLAAMFLWCSVLARSRAVAAAAARSCCRESSPVSRSSPGTKWFSRPR